MKYSQLNGKKLKPLGTKVAFIWLKPKSSLIEIPETYFNKDNRAGRFYLGKVISVGPEVTQLKIDDILMLQEYGVIGFPGAYQEDEIYFIEEKDCLVLVTNPDLSPTALYRVVSEAEEKHLAGLTEI